MTKPVKYAHTIWDEIKDGDTIIESTATTQHHWVIRFEAHQDVYPGMALTVSNSDTPEANGRYLVTAINNAVATAVMEIQ